MTRLVLVSAAAAVLGFALAFAAFLALVARTINRNGGWT